MLGAAFVVSVTVFLFWLKTKIDREEADEERRNRLRGARAMLVSDLNEFHDFISEAADQVLIAFEYFENRMTPKPELEMPSLDTVTKLRLTTIIQLAGNHSVEDQVAELLKELQLVAARLGDEIRAFNTGRRGTATIVVDRNNFRSSILSIVLSRLRIIRMFPYARFETESVQINNFSESEITSSLVILELFDVLNSTEREYIYSKLQAHS